jgi:hypothetical protein
MDGRRSDVMGLDKLDAMLDTLESDLPKLMLDYPDADGADFWVAFAIRSTAIEGMATSKNTLHVRRRLDRMLDSRGLIPIQSKAG